MKIVSRTAHVGSTHVFKGRVFTVARLEPYTRKDGGETELAFWQSLCCVCGGPLTVSTPRVFDPGRTSAFYNKRCRTCIDTGRK